MKIKKIISALLIMTLLMIGMNSVYAAGSFSVNLTPSSTRVSNGSDFTVTIKISGITVTDGISVLGATLKYDSDVLTIESDKSVEGKNGWVPTANIDNKGVVKLNFDQSEAVKDDTEVATVKFKVNDSTSVKATTIQMVSITGSSAAGDTSISDVSTNISIGAATINTSPSTSNSPIQSSSATPTTSTTPTATSTVKPSNTLNTSNTENKNTTTVKNEDMPNTGAETYVLPLILFIAALGIISFVGYKKIEEK